jgi:hypothetical protein
MLKKLTKLIKSMAEQEPFDPSVIGDPLAMEVEWTPAKSGGANFRTHKLVLIGADRIEFHSSIGAKLFYLLFLIVGMGILIGVPYAAFSNQNPILESGVLMPMLVGMTFACVGGALYYFGTAPVVFDARKSCFWKGRKSPDKVMDPNSLKVYAEFQQIHAIQLISEYCRGNKSSYYSYEMNLVLQDGSRINVVDHGNRDKLWEDAHMLSEFLGKPVWSAL